MFNGLAILSDRISYVLDFFWISKAAYLFSMNLDTMQVHN